MKPAAGFLAYLRDEQGLDPRVDVLKTIIECRCRNSVVIEIKEPNEQLSCGLSLNNPLPGQHQHMGNIDEDIGICDITVCIHGREKMHHLTCSLSSETAPPHHVTLHPFHNLSIKKAFS